MKLVNTHKLFVSFLLLLLIPIELQAQTWTLEQCIDTALIHNQSLVLSKNDILIGQEKQKEIQSQLLPKVNASADYKYYSNLPFQLMPLSVFGGPEGQFKEAQFGVPHNINVNLQIGVPLLNTRVYSAIKAAKINNEVQVLNHLKNEEQLIYTISTLYYNLQLLNRQKSFIDSNIIQIEQLNDIASQLQKQGIITNIEITRLELQKNQLTNQLFIMDCNINNVTRMLKQLMGVNQDTPFYPMEIIDSISTEPSLQKTTIDQQLLNTQKRLLNQQIKTSKQAFYPSISLYGNYGTIGYGYHQNNISFLNFYPIGFTGIKLNIPIYNGQLNQYKMNQQKFQLKNIEIQETLIQERNSIELTSALNQKRIQERILQSNLQSIELLARIYRETILSQQVGISSFSDIIKANMELQEAQQQYISTRIEVFKNELLIKQLTGN
jgi:outer membrane protein TolC